MPVGRPFVLHEASYQQLLATRPTLAVLPWGATEAHGWHLPHGTDVIEATAVAEAAVTMAAARGAGVLLLPTIPFGNNAQQQDQVATVHLSTSTAAAILRDVATSLGRQGIDRLVIVNGHGGNAFPPLVRDVMLETGATIAVVDFWKLVPEASQRIFDDPGDHAGELETSLVLHIRPDLVEMEHAGDGRRVPFVIESLSRPGVWTPRPWSTVHPDTGCGNPRASTAEKGRTYFEAITASLAEVLVDFAAARKGQSPYL